MDTRVAEENDASRGWVKGQPIRYIRNHHMRGKRKHPDQAEHFWSQVRIDPDGCWEWLGTRDDAGYGRAYFNGTMQRAHRVAYALTYGGLPAELDVCHTCDNPPCCRPDDLFAGTEEDNMRDAAAKGRTPRGSQHHASILNEEQVTALRQRYAMEDITVAELAREVGLKRLTLRSVLTGVNYRHLPGAVAIRPARARRVYRQPTPRKAAQLRAGPVKVARETA